MGGSNDTVSVHEHQIPLWRSKETTPIDGLHKHTNTNSHTISHINTHTNTNTNTNTISHTNTHAYVSQIVFNMVYFGSSLGIWFQIFV
jgi:hypothetical protein